jgi:hypothetical protein
LQFIDQDQEKLELQRLLELRELQGEQQAALWAARDYRERCNERKAFPQTIHYFETEALTHGTTFYALCAALTKAIKYYADPHASGLGILSLIGTSEYITANCSKDLSTSQDYLDACRLTEELKRIWKLDPSEKIETADA